MEFEQLLKLIDHVSDSKLTSFQYEGENLKINMECGQAPVIMASNVDMPAVAVQPQQIPAVQEAPAEKEPEGILVRSPLVGTFYAAPSEEAEPFVKVGDKVKKGQVLAIVEAMKLMNDIESDFDGQVAEIYVKNGEAVDYGKPLFRLI